MKKKFLSLVLTLAMLCSILCIGGVTAFAEATQWDGNPAVSFSQGGTGISSDPYKISTAAELKLFANIVNGLNLTEGFSKNSSAYAELTADIVLNEGTFDTSGNYITQNGELPIQWVPIGVSNGEIWVSFQGDFNGHGHTISGLYFNNPEQNSVGLFGNAYNSDISNVGVINSYIIGDHVVGGVCGYKDLGTIANCYNTGTVCGSNFVGGVCGESYNIITNCYNIGTVKGDLYVGGVCGKNSGTITDCYNTGTISSTGSSIGGVSGYSNGTINNSFNAGAIIGTSDIGGVCGDKYSTATITNAYYLNTSCATSDGGEAKTATQFASGEVAYLLNGSTSEGDLTWFMKNGLPTFDKLGDIAIYENNVYSTKRNPNNPYYTTEVTYSVAPGYTVTIPEDARLDTDFTLSARNVVLDVGKRLVVSVSGAVNESGSFTVTNGKTGELSYTLSDKNNSETTFINNAAVLTVNPAANTAGSVTLYFSEPLETVKYSGNYSGTLTFTVSVDDISNS